MVARTARVGSGKSVMVLGMGAGYGVLGGDGRLRMEVRR